MKDCNDSIDILRSNKSWISLVAKIMDSLMSFSFSASCSTKVKNRDLSSSAGLSVIRMSSSSSFLLRQADSTSSTKGFLSFFFSCGTCSPDFFCMVFPVVGVGVSRYDMLPVLLKKSSLTLSVVKQHTIIVRLLAKKGKKEAPYRRGRAPSWWMITMSRAFAH